MECYLNATIICHWKLHMKYDYFTKNNWGSKNFTFSKLYFFNFPLYYLDQGIKNSIDHMQEHKHNWRTSPELWSAECRGLLRSQQRKNMNKWHMWPNVHLHVLRAPDRFSTAKSITLCTLKLVHQDRGFAVNKGDDKVEQVVVS